MILIFYFPENPQHSAPFGWFRATPSAYGSVSQARPLLADALTLPSLRSVKSFFIHYTVTSGCSRLKLPPALAIARASVSRQVGSLALAALPSPLSALYSPRLLLAPSLRAVAPVARGAPFLHCRVIRHTHSTLTFFFRSLWSLRRA
jgi:hypothetical protein